MQGDDISTAYEHYRFCISYFGDSATFWCALGVLYFKNEQWTDSIIAFQRALYLKCDMAEPWVNLGVIYTRQNLPQNAKKMYSNGFTNCQGSTELRNLSLGIGRPASLVDVDDSTLMVHVADQFALEYVAAVPKLPIAAFEMGDVAEQFSILSSFPRSLFGSS
jgi:tetratricopeptide (TPR) repeat protein